MKAFIGWFEKTMSAVTFAEAGEFDTAREIMGTDKARPASALSWAERMAAAVALAEGGLHDDALIMANGKLDDDKQTGLSDFLQDVGLMSAQVRFAVMKVQAC